MAKPKISDEEKKKRVGFMFSALQRKLGTLMGHTARKDKDTVDLWKRFCLEQIGVKPTDRLIDMMKIDMDAGGIDLTGARILDKQAQHAGAQADMDVISNMTKTFSQFAAMLMQKDMQHAQQMSQTYDQMIKEKQQQLIQQSIAAGLPPPQFQQQPPIQPMPATPPPQPAMPHPPPGPGKQLQPRKHKVVEGEKKELLKDMEK